MIGEKYTKQVSWKASVTTQSMVLYFTSVQHDGSNPTPLSPNVLKFEFDKIKRYWFAAAVSLRYYG